MCFINEANFSAATLIVISEIFKARNDIRSLVFSSNKNFASQSLGDIDDEDDEVFVDVDKIQDQ